MTGLTISANSGGVTLSNAAYNPVVIDAGVSVTNSTGAALQSTLTTYWTIGNSGTLDATGIVAGSDGILLAAGGSITNELAGRISGYAAGVSLAGTGTLVNQGSITASQTAGYGYNYSAGVFTAVSAGVIMGGGGVSNATSGVIAAYLEGVAVGGGGSVVNAGRIVADSTAHGFGVVLTAGGSVNDASNATITGGVDAVLTFGNTSTVANQGVIDGQRYIGVVLAAGGTVSNLTGGTINGGFAGIDSFGAFADAVTNATGGTIDGGKYALFGRGDTFTLTNAGAMNGTSVVGVVLVAASTLSNAASGIISGGFDGVYTAGTAASTITNDGTLIGVGYRGVWMADGGTLTNDQTGRISGAYDAVFAGGSTSSTITNHGILVGTVSIGVWMAAGGSVTNDPTGTISGQVYGVSMTNDGGTVVNSGSITDSQLFSGAGVQLAAGGAVTNSAQGNISSKWIGVQIGASTTTSVGGTVVNQGTIFASDGTNGAAIWIHGPGAIYNAASGTIDGGPYAIVAYYQTTVLNQGSIGGTEFAFDAINPGFADRIIDAPGAVFSGLVSGGNALGSTVSSTLELASASSAGTISGLGVQFVDFGQVTIDAGAAWTLTGGNTLGAGSTLTNSGSLTLGSTSAPDAGMLVNNGTIVLNSSTLTAADIMGAGTVTVGAGSVLIAQGTVAGGETIAFAGVGAVQIESLAAFSGAIAGFNTTDGIIVAGTVTSASDAGGGLVLQNGTSVIGTLDLVGNFAGGSFLTVPVVGANGGAATEIELSSVSWLTDAPGNFDDPTHWSGDTVPGANANATIDFSNDPQVLHSSGSDTVNSLNNTAGDFVMSGGTLTTALLDNGSLMQWTGGSIVLNGTAGTSSLSNTAGATLTIAPAGQRLSTTGTGTASLTNAGTIVVSGGSGTANIDATLSNTGTVIVTQGTLSLNGGGSSNGAGLQGGAGGVLQFGLPASAIANSFSITGGEYAVGNTTVDGGTLDVSAAASVFFVDSLRLAGAGTLLLGTQNATAQNGFVQGPSSWAGATGIPFLSGTGTLTVFGGGTLVDGVESGSGLTRLIGTNQLGGSIQLDGGRTVENDGWMTWSSGNIALGAGDAAAANQSGTITNVAGATFYVTADARIGNAGAGTSVFDNAGVTAVFAGAGETDIDAAVVNPGFIQAQTGTLSLNGGGSSAGANLYVTTGAVLQFGTLAGTSAGGTFSITSGQYTAGYTAITGGTLDVSAASAAVFSSQLEITAGALLLGAQPDAVVQGGLEQTGGLLKGSSVLTVYAGAALLGGVQSGAATTRLYGTSVLGGTFALDGGRTLENDGWLNWSSGNIALGSGDASAVTQSGTLTNVAGATVYVTADGRIATSGAGSGVVNNAGVIAVFAGAGETDIDAFINDTGGLQVQSGVLGLNGGGTLAASGLYVAPNAILQFGTAASTGVGGTFSFTGGPYIVSNTVVNGSTVDLSAVAGVSFGASLTVSGGTLLLGGNFAGAGSFTQTGGALSGTGYFYATGPAQLDGGLETGGGRTVLEDGGSIGAAVAFDGGRSVENAGVLVWTGGSITLGGGDPGAATQAATLINDGGAVLEIETTGTINAAGFAGSGTISNEGTIIAGGLGTTAVYANLFNNGVVDVTAGTLALEQGVGGTGTFMLDGAATLDFVTGAGSSNTMQFLHPGGTLEADSAGQFGAAISGFVPGDTIDARAVGFVTGTTTVGFTGGTLTVSEGVNSAGFALSGSYQVANFQLASDGHGGTAVTYV